MGRNKATRGGLRVRESEGGLSLGMSSPSQRYIFPGPSPTVPQFPASTNPNPPKISHPSNAKLRETTSDQLRRHAALLYSSSSSSAASPDPAAAALARFLFTRPGRDPP